MKTLSFILSLSAAILFTFSAAVAQQENRSLTVRGSYNGIAVGGSHQVNFQKGPAGEPITVTGHRTDLDNLEIYVKNNSLHVKFKKGYNSKTGSRVEIYVKNPVLKEAAIGGSATLNISGGMESDKTEFAVGGSGTINVDRIEGRKSEFSIGGSGKVVCHAVNVKNVEVAIGGSGKVELSGTAEKLEASVAGSGSVDARELNVQNADIMVAGSAVVQTHCTRKIDATIAGGGKVYYSGEPPTISHHGKGKNFIRL